MPGTSPDLPLRLPFPAETSDKAAQSLTSNLEILAVDAIIRMRDFGRQTIKRGVQDLSEQFNIVVRQIELHRGSGSVV